MSGDVKSEEFERRLGLAQRFYGQGRIGVAMDQQHRGFCPHFSRESGRIGEHPRIADDARHDVRASRADMQRHHRALAETDQGQSLVGQATGLKLGIDIGVQAGRREANACRPGVR